MSVLSYGSTIYLLKVPCINRENAVKTTVQSFLSLSHLTFDDYAIVSNNSFKLHASFETVSQYNYLIFLNNITSAINWFCYIDDVQYVNKECCIVSYSVDSVTTFINRASFKDSFVLREHLTAPWTHSSLDVNRQSEPNICAMDYTLKTAYSLGGVTRKYVLLANCTPSGEVRQYSLNGTAFSGYIEDGVDPTSTSFQTIINNFYEYGRESQIIGLFDVNTKYCNISSLNISQPARLQHDILETTFARPTQSVNYVPKNKKCLQFPFVKLEVTDRKGSYSEFAFEKFTNSTPSFEIWGNCSGVIDSILINPINYDGHSQEYDLGVTTECAIPCSYGPTIMTNANNSNKQLGQIVNGLSSLAITVGSGNVIGGVLSAFNLANNFVQSENNAITETSRGHNSVSSEIVKALKLSPFKANVLVVRDYVMRSYDNFFERYGYAINQIKVPNVASANTFHQGYQFTKTNGLNVSIPTLQNLDFFYSFILLSYDGIVIS